jgi:putative ABC transport system permease protein
MGIADAVRKRLVAVDSTVPQFPIVDLESAVIAYRDPQTFTAGMWGSFAGFGLILAAVGVYGMIRSWVTAHIAEIGVRLAVGAQPSHVVWLVLHRTLGSCVVGVLAGVLGAVGLRTVIASQLYGMSPADPVVFASVAVVITLTALLAAVQPARWAVRIDPLMVLRQN